MLIQITTQVLLALVIECILLYCQADLATQIQYFLVVSSLMDPVALAICTFIMAGTHSFTCWTFIILMFSTC